MKKICFIFASAIVFLTSYDALCFNLGYMQDTMEGTPVFDFDLINTDTPQCKFSTKSACQASCRNGGTCTQNITGCWGCQYLRQPLCPTNCKTCSDGKCSKCKDGYFHYDNNADLCVPVDYVLADGTKVIQPAVAYPNYCAQVGQKWATTGANKSRATASCKDINCGSTHTDTNGYATCKECKAGYVLENNRCVSKCVYQSSSSCNGLANVKSCSYSDGCYVPTGCKPGYYLLSSHSNGKISGYTCKEGIPHCTDHYMTTTCRACESGYTLKNNKCLKNSVSGNCPSGLSKSADGCCCVK